MEKGNENKRPPLLRGWGLFDKKALAEVREKKLLKHIYTGVSAACDLNCIYCQTKSGRAMPGELEFEERISVLEQAQALGCEMVHIAARGEPTVDPLFAEQLAAIHRLDMLPVIFTHGGNIDESWADRLWENEASVIVKIHSFDRELQDWFAATKGYTARREQGIQKLIGRGFNQGEETRLGADILVMKRNYGEIENIFRWCRDNNIFPLVKPFLCEERGKSKFVMENLYVEPDRIKELYHRLAEIDREEYGYDWEPTPPYAGVSCNYYLYHILITIMGDVWPCIGLEHMRLGNIRERSLKECWDDPIMDRIRNIHQEIKGVCTECDKYQNEICYGCPCRRVYLKGKESFDVCNDCWNDNM